MAALAANCIDNCSLTHQPSCPCPRCSVTCPSGTYQPDGVSCLPSASLCASCHPSCQACAGGGDANCTRCDGSLGAFMWPSGAALGSCKGAHAASWLHITLTLTHSYAHVRVLTDFLVTCSLTFDTFRGHTPICLQVRTQTFICPGGGWSLDDRAASVEHHCMLLSRRCRTHKLSRSVCRTGADHKKPFVLAVCLQVCCRPSSTSRQATRQASPPQCSCTPVAPCTTRGAPWRVR